MWHSYITLSAKRKCYAYFSVSKVNTKIFYLIKYFFLLDAIDKKHRNFFFILGEIFLRSYPLRKNFPLEGISFHRTAKREKKLTASPTAWDSEVLFILFSILLENTFCLNSLKEDLLWLKNTGFLLFQIKSKMNLFYILNKFFYIL